MTHAYIEYSDDKAYNDEKESEPLPLGKSFQNHVKLYMRYKNHTLCAQVIYAALSIFQLQWKLSIY